MTRLRFAQIGTGHGHAAGKLTAMLNNDDVDVAGVFEPDAVRREVLDTAGSPFHGVRWYASEQELLGDPNVVAVASEGRNDESLAQTLSAVRAGKHVWYDKPAGDDWQGWQEVVAEARERKLLIQMGYMFRYHEGFAEIARLARTGTLGQIFSIRAQMSTSLDIPARQVIAQHRGGIFYDLAGHMIDQIVWLLGRPTEVTSFFRQDGGNVPGFADNTHGVLSFPGALATIDISAIEPPPTARRFEVYGLAGSAIMEPFEPSGAIRLCLTRDVGALKAGVQMIPVREQSRQDLYDAELVAFVARLRGQQLPERTLEHDLLVQETLLRLTGGIVA
ncbi:MAG: Gfo/Idh/MocA family oxidoreductase [Burkholderiales bacterium]|nr:Gfo/Idh/MocA family oxidoreductase [Burkholderiales bacterium]